MLSLVADAGCSRRLKAVCVGTDRSTGDSLGPLVGTMLCSSGFGGEVLGTLDEPVHAENLGSLPSQMFSRDSAVVGVDACLGSREEVGKILVRRGPLRPGLGVRKRLTALGDFYIAGVVNVGGFMEYTVLQNTRLSLVLRMAKTIASGLMEAEMLMKSPTHTEDQEFILAAPEIAVLRSQPARAYDP